MNLTLAAGLIAIACYGANFCLAALATRSAADDRQDPRRRGILATAAAATLAHGISAWGVLHGSDGFRFGTFELATMIAAVTSLLVLLSAQRKPVENLFLGLSPLAVIAIAAALHRHGDYPPARLDVGLASHVLVSVLAYSLMTIAAAQSLLLAFQNHCLRHGRAAAGLLRHLPALEDMETLLFTVLWAGQALLTVSMVAGFLFIADGFARAGVTHKTVFSLAAWLAYCVLLWGRHRLGWRGITAVKGSLLGLGLLAMGVFGSKFVLEFILPR